MAAWALLVAVAVAAQAMAADESDAPAVAPEPDNTGWALYLDNDLFLSQGRDEQYTGGAALTLSGQRATDYPWSLDPLLRQIDHWTGVATLGGDSHALARHSVHFGMAAFTPTDISAEEPIRDDRPYASLAFVSNTQKRALLSERVLYQSSLLVGVLGTDVVPAIQDAIHDAGTGRAPAGWDNQIADGGEPTASYVVARYETIAQRERAGFGAYQVQSVLGASVGLATQAGIGINARWGRFGSPWWGFVPDYAQFIGYGTPIASEGQATGPADLFVWGGVNVRASLYNGLLEGQFRDSAVTYDRDELRSVLAEASLGVTWGIGTATDLTLAFRARTPELRQRNARLPIWGSVVLSRAY